MSRAEMLLTLVFGTYMNHASFTNAYKYLKIAFLSPCTYSEANLLLNLQEPQMPLQHIFFCILNF
jgi:hypothetical protein